MIENIFTTIITILLILVGIVIYFWPIFIPIFIFSAIRKNMANKKMKQNVIHAEEKSVYNKRFTDINKEELRSLEINDINQLKQYLYAIFLDFEKAYNNLDYKTMNKNSTSKLYNTYHSAILLNLKFAQKKIIDNIELKRMFIYSSMNSQYRQTIYTTIEIEYVSYMEDYSGQIISGTTEPITEAFEVVFVKSVQKDGIKCPNCAATVTDGVCDYCGTEVKSTDFEIDSIKKIVQ